MPNEKKENAFSLYLSEKLQKARKSASSEQALQRCRREWNVSNLLTIYRPKIRI